VQVADAVFQALTEDQFYILTHPEEKEYVRTRWKIYYSNVVRRIHGHNGEGSPTHIT
jgi:hypothetical protein